MPRTPNRSPGLIARIANFLLLSLFSPVEPPPRSGKIVAVGHPAAIAIGETGMPRSRRLSNPGPMNIRYEHARRISESEFVDLLQRSTLAARRPVEDAGSIQAMLAQANLLCTAWDGDKLVGLARSLTDFQFCCYLSDLAVDEAYQKQGIGRELIRLTRSKLGRKAFIIQLAAPKAEGYYPKLGFEAHHSAWILPAKRAVA